MPAKTIATWVFLGLLGLVLAAGVTLAASRLSSQTVGLSAEPPSAGDELAAPAATAAPTRTPHPRRRRPERTATPTPAATVVPVLPTAAPDAKEDNGSGRGRGRNRGRGGDDDD